jgi:uncharacterized membrane protein YfcA
MSAHVVAFVLITFGAAIVNGALGYGFSSITIPLALLFLSNRVLNPALVLVEIPLNASMLWVPRLPRSLRLQAVLQELPSRAYARSEACVTSTGPCHNCPGAVARS